MASIIKREWKTPTGKSRMGWRVQYYVNGKPRFKQFPTKAKALKYVETVSVVREGDRQKLVEARSPTMEQWAWTWLERRQTGSDGLPPLDPETVVWYRGHLANHILPALGRFRVAELRRAQIESFREALLDPSLPTTSRLSRRTVKKILTTVKTVLTGAIAADIIEANPAATVGLRLSSRDRSEIEVHSIEDMTLILRTAAQIASSAANRSSKRQSLWPSRYYPMLLLLVYGGLRISEARGLDVKDINLMPGVVTVRVRQRADRRGRIGSPKSAKGFREVHLPNMTEPTLRRVIDGRSEGLAFQTTSGAPIDPNNFRKRCWEYVQKRAGTAVKTLHSVRHFYASRQIANGVNPKELAELLGHADEAFTLKTYGHLFRDQETENRRRRFAELQVLVHPEGIETATP